MENYEILNEKRWERLQNRKQIENSLFFYSVITTGIYCRIGCPSKLPKKNNILFFDSIQQAKTAGFRPCLRCKPEQEEHLDHHLNIAIKSCKIIEQSAFLVFSKEIANILNISLYHFQRIFKKQIGITPKKYSLILLENKLKKELKLGMSITNAIYNTGYNSNNRFYENVTFKLGMKPKDFINGGINNTIRYLILENSFGIFLVALTTNGICHYQIGNNSIELEENLKKLFNNSILIKEICKNLKYINSKIIKILTLKQINNKLPFEIKKILYQNEICKFIVKYYMLNKNLN